MDPATSSSSFYDPPVTRPSNNKILQIVQTLRFAVPALIFEYCCSHIVWVQYISWYFRTMLFAPLRPVLPRTLVSLHQHLVLPSSYIIVTIIGFVAKVCFNHCSTSTFALGSPGWLVGRHRPCPKYLIKPYNAIFLRAKGSRTSKMIFWNVKFTNTNSQNTNSACDKVPEMPDICYIF